MPPETAEAVRTDGLLESRVCTNKNCGHLTCLGEGEFSSEEVIDIVDETVERVASYYRDIFLAKRSIKKMKLDVLPVKEAENSVHKARLFVEKYLSRVVGSDWESYPAVCQDPDALSDFHVFIQRELLMIPMELATSAHLEPYEKGLCNSFAIIIGSEIQARIELAYLAIDHPEIALSLFTPDILQSFTPDFQRIVASDINKSEARSVVLGVLKRQALSNNQDGLDLEDYLSHNDLARDAQTFFDGARFGILAVNASVCPLNQFGICLERMDIQTISAEHLKSIQQDAAQKAKTQYRDRAQALKQFSGRFGKDPLRIEKLYARAIDDDTPTTKRKGIKGLLDVVVGCAPPAHSETEKPKVSRIIVKIDGNEIKIDTENDPESADRAIRAIIASDIVADYIKKYNRSGIVQFFERAIAKILFCPDYHSEESIRIIVKSKKKYHVDGNQTHLYRLSGKDLQGGGGGPIGQATRILFIPHGNSSERRITISNVQHKSDLVNDIPIPATV